MKESQTVPYLLQVADITCIYKGKGDKNDLANERGIFGIPRIKQIFEKLIYEDIYDTVDINMSDSNAGARKKRNCRDHLFIVNGVLNYVLKEKRPPVDLQIYDIEMCFDKLNLREALNDFWEAGVQDDKFALLYELNKKLDILVKTTSFETKRESVEEVVAQGGVFGRLKCSNVIDTIGKDCMETGENIYVYKNCVNIPPLSFVDDLFAISECGSQSVVTNAVINSKVDQKNLKFGIDKEKGTAKKCRQIHVGRTSEFCPNLKADHASIPKVSEEKYLGDIVSYDGTITKTIKLRESKGTGAISQIMTILKMVSLGHHYMRIAMLLRNTHFINKVLVNSEIWYPIKEDDLKNLEKLDESLLRQILHVPALTPIELLYLELGLIPLSDLVKCRRILYLHNILARDENQLLSRFFKAQNGNLSKGDWSEIVKKDLSDFSLKFTFDQIKHMKYEKFKSIVKKACKIYTLNHLLLTKSSHRKGKNLEYSKIETKEYLLTNKITVSQAMLLFKIRSRMLEVKMNFKEKYLNNDKLLLCKLCENDDLDEQSHVTLCPAVKNNQNLQFISQFEASWNEMSKLRYKSEDNIV